MIGTPERADDDGRYRVPSSYRPYIDDAFRRLSRSSFRSRFHLSESDAAYAREKGSAVIASHAADFIRDRLAPAGGPTNDGKQTPMRGHPVFTAQHATATCCRSCLEKWYRIPKSRPLTQTEQDFCVSLVMMWIASQIKKDYPDSQGNQKEQEIIV